MSLPGRLLSVDGIRVFVHHRTDGTRRDGPPRAPLLLVHGFMVSHFEWRHIIPDLCAAGHEVIAIDLPGFGESDRPAVEEFGYDAPSWLATITGVLDTLGIERATLVGHSMGGALSLYAAANRPERVERLVLIDPLIYDFPMPPEARLILAPLIGAWIFRTVYSRRLLRQVMRRDIYRDPALASDEWIDYLWQRVTRPGGMNAAHAALRMCSSPGPFAAAVRAVRAPTMIVWGEEDRLFPASMARRAAADLPGAQVKIIPVCGHSPPEERPAELVRALLPFVGAQAGGEWRASA